MLSLASPFFSLCVVLALKCSSSSASVARTQPDFSTYVVLSVKGLTESAEAAAFLDDDIEDPPSPPYKEPLPLDPPFSTSSLPSPLSPEASATASGEAEVRGEEAGANSTAPVERPAAAAAAAGSPPSSADEASRERSPLSSPGSDCASRSGGPERPAAPSNDKGKQQQQRQAAMSFPEALAAFGAAVKGPGVPWHVRVALARVRGLRQPADGLHASFHAALLQVASYLLRCAGDLRKLRHLDQGRARASLQEVQTLKSKSASCMLPIRLFLEESRSRLGPPLRQRGGDGGWDRAASFLDALSAYAVAMERNYSALTTFLEARLSKCGSASLVQPLKEKREAAQMENLRCGTRTDPGSSSYACLPFATQSSAVFTRLLRGCKGTTTAATSS
ncbi:hypothetical protein Esti_000881 [Eimeria stiedai]